VRLAFGDAFDLRRVQAVNLAAALTIALRVYPARQSQWLGEVRAQAGVSADLAADVAHHPPEIGAQRPQGAVGALELSGMRMALVAD
jgi:hypothetical protein